MKRTEEVRVLSSKLPKQSGYSEYFMALLHFLLGQPVAAEDFTLLFSVFEPSEDLFFAGLYFLGVYKNLDLTDFDAWRDAAQGAVEALAKACKHTFRSEAEKKLVSLGLAVRTYPFELDTPAVNVLPEELREYQAVEQDTNAVRWSLYLVSLAALNWQLEHDDDRITSLFIWLLKTVGELEEPFAALNQTMADTLKKKGALIHAKRQDPV